MTMDEYDDRATLETVLDQCHAMLEGSSSEAVCGQLAAVVKLDASLEGGLSVPKHVQYLTSSGYPASLSFPAPPPHSLPPPVVWGVELTNVSFFSSVHEISRTFEILTPKTPNSRWGGG